VAADEGRHRHRLLAEEFALVLVLLIVVGGAADAADVGVAIRITPAVRRLRGAGSPRGTCCTRTAPAGGLRAGRAGKGRGRGTRPATRAGRRTRTTARATDARRARGAAAEASADAGRTGDGGRRHATTGNTTQARAIGAAGS